MQEIDHAHHIGMLQDVHVSNLMMPVDAKNATQALEVEAEAFAIVNDLT